jgi:hypothetical protein
MRQPSENELIMEALLAIMRRFKDSTDIRVSMPDIDKSMNDIAVRLEELTGIER